jgi:hypothetical protein
MRLRSFLVGSILTLSFGGTSITAQDALSGSEASPDSSYFAPPRPSTSPAVAGSEVSYSLSEMAILAGGPSCDADAVCEDDLCCSGGGFCETVSIIESLSLKHLLGMRCCDKWDVGGWTQVGYHNNNQPLSQAYNDLLSFNDLPDNANVHQQWFYLGRRADAECGWDWGARADIIYGTDGQKTQSFGNPDAGVRGFGTFDASWDHGIYGWAIPQLYGEVAYNDLSVKIGHFFTIIGYEVVPSPGNFFYSRSYTMFNSEPFTHTGALATYSGYEDLTLYGGWVLGWDTGFDQLNSGNAFLGGVTAQCTDDVSLAYATCYGNFGWRDGGSDDSYCHSIVLSWNINDCWTYVAQSDLVSTTNDGVSEFDTIGLNNYLFYKWSDLISLGGRHEWWKADGVSFNAVTGGVNIHVCDNLVFRPEVRMDWAPAIGLSESTAGVDMVLTY